MIMIFEYMTDMGLCKFKMLIVNINLLKYQPGPGG